ncbi:ankyrin repeat domain-containing protein [Diaphorobacter sp. HDW4B]|nr:ankyrin repeat domain-containing protein [Diaphorobacter sp. HDW4B]
MHAQAKSPAGSTLAARILMAGLLTLSAMAAAAQGSADKAWMSEQLLQASRAGDVQAVRKLLAKDAPVNAQDAQGNTPLLLATAGNHIEVARSLILHGADVNIQNAQQDSAYLLAGARGNLEILRMTLSRGADLKSTNRYGGTALIPACERGHVATAKTLMDAGVNVNHVNRLGWTCLLEAILLSDGGAPHQQIVRDVIAAGADVNLADKDGVTPLAHARQRKQQAMVEILTAAGAR